MKKLGSGEWRQATYGALYPGREFFRPEIFAEFEGWTDMISSGDADSLEEHWVRKGTPADTVGYSDYTLVYVFIPEMKAPIPQEVVLGYDSGLVVDRSIDAWPNS